MTATATTAPESPTWRQLLAEARAALRATEARWIVEELAGGSLAEVADLDQPAPPAAAGTCRSMVRRRLAGEPLQYVLGRWGFRTLDLTVDRRALIPRPETEQVVEVARRELSRLRTQGAGDGPWVAVDLGTGSGAIALSLLVEEPGVVVWATDVAPGALSLARGNAAAVPEAVGRLHLAQGDWYAALPAALGSRVSLVVSNPPYVAGHELAGLPGEVADWEPREALVSGPSGLEAIETVLGGAPAWLTRPGAVVVEIAPHQAAPALELASSAGFTDLAVVPDLTGRDRVLVARVGRAT